jgi:hypothetical protein
MRGDVLSYIFKPPSTWLFFLIRPRAVDRTGSAMGGAFGLMRQAKMPRAGSCRLKFAG